ncbi:MAG: hypothetical protein HYZ28_14360 [Myxococcales bacterium]|nr:hypothetical protein [Myxococcales bacterium]
MQRDLKAELEAEDGIHPEAWRPRVGEVLVGRLSRYDRAPDLYSGGLAWVAVVEPEDGAPRVAIWLGTVLLDLFKRHRPKPGERLGLKRLPDSEPVERGRKPCARYALRVDRPEELPVFEEPAGETP